MARAAGLNPGRSPSRPATRLLPMLAAVLAGHAAFLYWLATARSAEPRLRPLATPMFTRLLQPTTPPAVVAPPPPAPAVPRRPRARHIVPPVPESSTAAAAPAQSPSDTPPAGAEVRAQEGAARAADEPPAPAAEADPGAAAASAGARPGSETTGTGTGTDAGRAPARAEGAAPEARDPGASPPAAAAEPPASTRTSPAPSDSWPGDTRLSYALSGRFRGGDLYGSARVQWQREGRRYQTRVEIALFPWVSQVLTSQGEIGAESLQPEAYEETRRGKSRGVRLGEESITLGNGQRIGRPPGVQDTASQFVELSHRFATGRERLEVGRSVSLWLVRPGGMDLWTYDIVQRETLKTAQLGEVEAFHLKPRPLARPRGNITAEMWFAPSLQFLPVRIRVTMGEEAEVDLLVETIEQR